MKNWIKIILSFLGGILYRLGGAGNVGLESYALIPITEVLLEWADEIVCMTLVQKVRLQQLTKKPIKCLDIPDSFEYRNPELKKLIIKAYK